MLKEAIEKIVEISGVKTFTVNGETYADRETFLVRPKLDLPACATLNSLDALVQFIQRDAIKYASGDMTIFVTIPSHKKAECYTGIDARFRDDRIKLFEAVATDVPGWDSETRLPFEQASIALQTRFQGTEDREYALRLLNQITCGGKVTYNDNGIATSVVTQKGITLQGTEAIRPLLKLKPYRTFQEVDQPEGLFLVRIDERGISFIEADGGMWKLKARATIKEYLVHRLKDLVESGKVVIAL